MSGLGQEKITRNLHEAVARLQKDIEQVEIWAAALSCFSQPVPEYKPDEQYRLGRHSERSSASD